jgi:hypothetical protein
MPTHTLRFAAGWLPFLVPAGSLLLGGCGGSVPVPKVELPKVVQNLPQTVTNAAQGVKQTFQLAGSLDLELAGPIKTSGCYASLTSIPGRSTILQLTSYNDPSAETFPSVLIWAPVTVQTPAELVNQTVVAQMFVQRDPQAAPWQTAAGKSVNIKFTAFEGVLVGQIEAGGMLTDVGNGSQAPVSGKIQATLK